jgi:hypothetical protein
VYLPCLVCASRPGGEGLCQEKDWKQTQGPGSFRPSHERLSHTGPHGPNLSGSRRPALQPPFLPLRTLGPTSGRAPTPGLPCYCHPDAAQRQVREVGASGSYPASLSPPRPSSVSQKPGPPLPFLLLFRVWVDPQELPLQNLAGSWPADPFMGGEVLREGEGWMRHVQEPLDWWGRHSHSPGQLCPLFSRWSLHGKSEGPLCLSPKSSVELASGPALRTGKNVHEGPICSWFPRDLP